jgi:hypothetical protein
MKTLDCPRTASAWLFAALCLASCSTAPPLPISQVVALSASGASPEQVAERVRTSQTSYALRGSDFVRLSQRGVADETLNALQDAFIHDVDRVTRMWVLGEWYGGCARCYPQQVNLALLDSGGDGMADNSRLGMVYTFSKPPGLPDWVPYYPGAPLGQRIWLDDIAAMVKSGAPQEQVAETIRGSRLAHIAGSGRSGGISTFFRPALKGADFVTLAKQGAGDAVLDALQEKFVSEYIEFSRLRHMHEGKGSAIQR